MAKIQKISETSVTNDTESHDTAQQVAPVVPVPARFVPKVLKVITLPLLKLAEGVPVYIRFDSATFVGKIINEPDAKKAAKQPPTMANITNLETGEMMQLMLGAVLQGILSDDYPDGSYVGKGFAIEQGAKKRTANNPGGYNTYKVAEIEV